MKRVPTRTPGHAGGHRRRHAATRGDPTCRDDRQRRAVEHRIEQRQQRRAFDPLAAAGLPCLRDDDVAPRRLGRAGLVRRLDLPAADAAAGVDELDQRGVRVTEEEVDVGGARGGEIQRTAIDQRDEEVHAPRHGIRRERFEHGRERSRGQRQRWIHAVAAGSGDRERQPGCR
jgi:hypothetical protein